MLKSNCHTHSLYCDGNNSLKEMAEEAVRRGFCSLGFSGHSPMNFSNDWAMTKDTINKYIDEIQCLKEQYKGKLDILCGIELDVDFCDVDLSKLDFIIGSMHQFRAGEKDYPIDLSADSLIDTVNNLFDGDWLKMCDTYFKCLADFICKQKPDVVGHFDLVTKYNEKYSLFDENDCEYQKSAIRAVDRILDCNKEIVFEVNTGAMYRVGNSKPYPAPFIMEHLKKRNAEITITSDSHCVDSIDFAFDKAVEYCKGFGFNEQCIFTSEGKIKCSI